MFSDIPKLFDRNFAIGFLIPSAIWFVVSTWLLQTFGYYREIVEVAEGFPALKGSITSGQISLGFAALLIFSFGLLLLISNNYIYKICEGYYGESHLKKYSLLKKIQLKIFTRLSDRAAAGDESADKELCLLYPKNQDWVLPTSFGNAIRSFETYSLVVYGLDAIPGWLRLVSVIPNSYMDSLSSTKSFVDFWVNLWFLSLMLSLQYIVCLLFFSFDLYNHSIILLWPPFIFCLASLAFSWLAKMSAIAWGEEVKSAFDLFILDLAAKLGLDRPKNGKHEREIWEAFTQMIIFREPDWRNRILEIAEEQKGKDTVRVSKLKKTWQPPL